MRPGSTTSGRARLGERSSRTSFRRHIEIAKRHAKTLVIHDRDAHADVLRILAEEGAPERVVLHCFSGDVEMARTCADLGYYLSYAGTVTFGNAQPLRNALAVTPRDRILVETDAPFLTPSPHRGRPNAPYLIPITLRAMAAVLVASEDELAGSADGQHDGLRSLSRPRSEGLVSPGDLGHSSGPNLTRYVRLWPCLNRLHTWVGGVSLLASRDCPPVPECKDAYL